MFGAAEREELSKHADTKRSFGKSCNRCNIQSPGNAGFNRRYSRANNGRASKANGRPINPTYLGRKISREEIVHRQFDSGNGTRQGIISQTTKERLNALEAEKAELINKIAVEKLKSNLIIQKHDIVKYLQSAVKKRPLQMIQLLIKQVVLYNDKIEIHFNYTDGKRPDDELHQAFSFYSFNQRITIDQHKIGKEPIVTDYEITLFI